MNFPLDKKWLQEYPYVKRARTLGKNEFHSRQSCFFTFPGPEVMHVYSATSISDPLDSAEADAQQQWPRLPDVPLWDTEPQLHSAITTG